MGDADGTFELRLTYPYDTVFYGLIQLLPKKGYKIDDCDLTVGTIITSPRGSSEGDHVTLRLKGINHTRTVIRMESINSSSLSLVSKLLREHFAQGDGVAPTQKP